MRDEANIPDHSQVGESRSNRVIERGVRTVKDQVRTLRLALQSRIGKNIPQGHAAMSWIVQHAADVVTKFQARHDGRTAYQRLLGEPCKEEVLEFGECVHQTLKSTGWVTWMPDGRQASGSASARSRLNASYTSKEESSCVGRSRGSFLKRGGMETSWNRSSPLLGDHAPAAMTSNGKHAFYLHFRMTSKAHINLHPRSPT